MLKIAVVDDDESFVIEYKNILKKLFNEHGIECSIDTLSLIHI